jgi:DMSO/TMAO reductase YedYZ molybdopterin-dependent catalytic subunit
MMRFASLSVLVLLLSPDVLPSQSPAPLTVIVEGVARSVPATSLRSLPRDTMRLVFHNQTEVIYEGVSLAAVLQTVGVRTDSLGGAALSTRVVAEAADGYRVVLALAELDASLGGRRILLADRMDGRPLPPNEGPWRLVVAGDSRGARSARQILRIRVAAEPR